jgi:ribosome maturation protein Sdo1
VQIANIVMNHLHFHNMIVTKSARLMKQIFHSLIKIVALHLNLDKLRVKICHTKNGKKPTKKF